MDDWDNIETIVVLLLLCAAVVFTYFKPIVIDESIYTIDNQVGE